MMHKIRVFIAIVLSIGIIFGMIRWFSHNSVVVDDLLLPVRQKIASITHRLGLKTTIEKPVTPVTPKPDAVNGIVKAVHPDFTVGQIKEAELQTLMQGKKTFGVPDADILLFQRCDFGSRYCFESYEQGSLFAYMRLFENNLQYQLHGYLRDKAENTALQHKASVCAEKLASNELFLSYYFSLFQSKGSLSKKDLLDLANNLGITGFDGCLENQSLLQLQKNMQLGRTVFGFATLPANIFVHKKTGTFILVPGLYDQKDVLGAIQWLVDEGK